MFGSPFASPFIIPVVAIICWMLVKIVKIKNGVDTIGWHERPNNAHVPPMCRPCLTRCSRRPCRNAMPKSKA